ncbi:hypothetical protein B9Y01_07915 [Acinetobacter baumannii]|nr:hypothetical protein B9Y01_07915 [Acinetobacter baumannii]QFH44088.1 hypothetical protein FR761_01030 [Acinetobacter baumannii]
MSAKLVVTLLATSLLTVGCVAYTDDPYYRGGYGYHDHDDDRYSQIIIKPIQWCNELFRTF